MQSFTVRVPATTANLGPGFDCLGLALSLWNQATFSFGESHSDHNLASHTIQEQTTRSSKMDKSMLEARLESVHIEVRGEGADHLNSGGQNLILHSALHLCKAAGLPLPPGLTIRCENHIPLGSGLGSSSAAILAGLLGANALLDQPFSNREILNMAAAIEGHPDNVAPALLGGLVIAIQNTSPPEAHEPVRITARRVPTARLFVAVAVPEMSLATRAARAALPARVPIADAVFNIGRASLVVEALRIGDLELLGEAMQDRLHQPYRLKLIPGAESAMQAARLAGAGAAALSGAGPGVVAFAQEDAAEIASAMVAAFEAAGLKARNWALAVAQNGASVAL